ncbi:hypothetical protein DL765_003298 [Monosporascus sp. GIB2]|nr:hypothetical protein DL765_003298 [Monosporascus sp. GIB2]
MDADPSATFGIEIKTIILGDPGLPLAYQKSRWKHNVKPLGEAVAKVHVAILPGWSASHIKGIARTVMQYKPEFGALAARFGSDRVASAWAMANSVEKAEDDNANPAPEAIQEQLESLGRVKDVVEAMRPKEGAQQPRPPPLELLAAGRPAGGREEQER